MAEADLRRTGLWLLAGLAGVVALLWVALANGFPLLFSDSGGYLRIGTELYYPLDRSVVYGLLIAPFARLGGLWAVIVAQAVATMAIVATVVGRIAGRRRWRPLLIVVAVLAGLTSLPWFVGQVMPDLLTGLIALVLFLILFDEGAPAERWLLPLVLATLVSAHLSHIPLAAGLIVVGTLAALPFRDRRTVLARGARAGAGVVLAALGLCTLNLIAEHRFAPSLSSDMFLTARLFDARIGQPVLAETCHTAPLSLCAALRFVEDPRRVQPGQDYLWDARSPRPALSHADPKRLDAEEVLLIHRTLATAPLAVLRTALAEWSEQLVRAHMGDGMAPYPDTMQVARQVRTHFPASVAAWQRSREQTGTLQRLAIVPDRWLALLVMLAAPLLLVVAYRRHDGPMFGLASLVIAAIVLNAGVCGMLSGSADRYQSRVLWLLPFLGAMALLRLLEPASGRAVPRAGTLA